MQNSKKLYDGVEQIFQDLEKMQAELKKLKTLCRALQADIEAAHHKKTGKYLGEE